MVKIFAGRRSLLLGVFLPISLIKSFAVEISWTNLSGGSWATAANWSPNQVPTGADTAYITNAGTYTVTSSANATVGALALGASGDSGACSLQISGGTFTVTNALVQTNGTIAITGGTLLSAGPFTAGGTVYETAGSWRLLVPGFANTFNLTNGELRGATITITNFNWVGANLYADAPGDKTIIPPGGTFNVIGNTARVLSYYAGGAGRGIDNYGSWNWSGNCVITAYPCVVNNYGTLAITGTGPDTGTPGTYAQFANTISTLPTFNNFGTITKSPGTNSFYFGACNLNNQNLIDCQSGVLWLYYGTTTNSGTINAQNTRLMAVNSTVVSSGSITLSTNSVFQADSGTVSIMAGSILSMPDTNAFRLNGGTVNLFSTNVATPSALILAGTLFHQTNNTIPVINQSGGTWRMIGSQTVSAYNFTNGELRGGTLTMTNCNWVNGNWYADAAGDKTIIPTNGVVNFLGTATRVLSYYAGGFGRYVDNFGTWNWTDNSTLQAYPCSFNNYGQVNITGNGAPSTYAEFGYVNAGSRPTWNNYGTFTKSPGTNIFYFACDLNNFGLIDNQSGQVSLYGSVITNAPGGIFSMGTGAQLFPEAGSTVYLMPGSALNGVSQNAVRVENATVYMQTINLSLPSLLLNNANSLLLQNTNNIIPAMNQNAGTWRLNVPVSLGTYNLTNGELRGANLLVTNFNWLGGQLNSDGPSSNLVTVASALNISGATAKYLSYWTPPGRTLINNGTASWSGAVIVGQGGATILNNNSLTQTGDTALQWGNTGAQAIFQNNGTFSKSAGSGQSYFYGTLVTNSGTMNVLSGGIRLGAAFVQNAGVANLGTNFQADSIVRVEAGAFYGNGTIAGSAFNNATFNPGASPGLIVGTHYTNSATSTLNLELGGTVAGTNYDQVRLSGASVLNGNLNVQFVNGFLPVLSNAFTVMTFANRVGTFASFTAPPNFEFTPIYSATNLVLLVTGLTNAPLQIGTAPTNITVWQPDPVTLSASASGSTPLSYQWLKNGTNIPNATNVTFTIPATQPSDSGTYTFQVTDGDHLQTNASALVTVIPFNGTIAWTNIAGGNWSTAANWLPNRVPNATNTAVIRSNGTYNVTVDGVFAVSNVVVGAVPGTGHPTLVIPNTLILGNHALFETNAALSLSGTLQTLGGVIDMGGRWDWNSGTLIGPGRTVVTNTGVVSFNSSFTHKYIVTNVLENYGTFTYSGDSGFGPGELLSFSGGAMLTNHSGGLLSIGSGNGFNYSGSQTPRSYLVNEGLIQAGGSRIDAPSSIGIDLINLGTLQNYGYTYINRGSNFGEIFGYNTIAELSIFGDPSTGEAFSFEPGTSFTGPRVNLACGGPVQWRATNTIHPGRLFVAAGSGGATYPNAEFRILANYTNNYLVSVARGGLTVSNPAVIVDLASYTGAIYNGAHDFTVVNYGTMYAGSFSHSSRTFLNYGSLVIRTNCSLISGSFAGTGRTTITNSATLNFAGASVDGQSFDNFGNASVTAGTPFTGNAYFENKLAGSLNFAGGSLATGPAAIANFGSLSGFGSAAVSTTNYNSVLADDSFGRTLTLSSYRQLAGVTEIRRGAMGGSIHILGGTLKGTNSITGTVLNEALASPGNPFGTLTVTSSYTNTSAGVQTMAIGGTNLAAYSRLGVGGTAYLAGTLNINFSNGFFPTLGTTFTAMTYTARSGVFDQILCPAYQFETIYLPNALILRASNALPVLSFTISGGNTQVVCNPFKLTASASDPDGVVTNIAFYMNGSLISSNAGNVFSTTFETDFPSTNIIEARALDDRNGLSASNRLVSIVTLPMYVLTLGGPRTNGFKVCMLGEAGSNYLLYATTNLGLPFTNWNNLGQMEYTNGIWRYFDPGTITNRTRRYYRAQRN